MGVETILKPDLLSAARGQWDSIDWSVVKQECRRYKDGSDRHPGSDNHPIMTWGIALIVEWKAAHLLDRLGLTRRQVLDWWRRELTVRLRKGLQLVEPRARIYVEWEAALICWLYTAFRASEIADLHLRYVKATHAMMALCAYPVRPTRHSPDDVESKMYKAPLYVPLAGARSWSGEREGGKRRMHHLGQSGFEVLLSGVMDIEVPTEFVWHRGIISALKPGWMGMAGRDVSLIRAAVRDGATAVVDELVEWLDGVGTLWPCRLVRFERGAACIGTGREINGNTRAIDTLAIHQTGTIEILASEEVNRNANMEPCGVSEFDHGNYRVEYRCWRGGEDDPQREVVLDPDHWGRVLWDVSLHRDGNHVVILPREATPVPPSPPEIPENSPQSWWVRHRMRSIAGAVFLASIFWALNQRGCF